MTINIPGVGEITIKTIILDLNGTLAVGGEVVPGAEERLAQLKNLGFKIILFTGDIRGNAAEMAQKVGIDLIKIQTAEDKLEETKKLDPETCVSIGNGQIDLPMMQIVKLAIVTLQAEGVYTKTLVEADIVVPSINDALDLFLDASRLIATMKR